MSISPESKRTPIIIKVSATIEKGGKLLLIKEKTPRSNGYKWNVVKGTLDPLKDDTLDDAIAREMKEEAGIKNFNIIGITKSFVLKKKGVTVVQINYYVTTNEVISIDNIKLEDDEDIIALKLFAKDELSDMEKDDFLTERAYILINDWVEKKNNI